MTELEQVRFRLEELGLHRASELLDVRLKAAQHSTHTWRFWESCWKQN
jgi:hypothetical protein